MRLNLYLLIAAIGFGSCAFAQEMAAAARDYPRRPDDPSVFKYYPYYDNTLKVWGYSDVNGKILIRPAFLEVDGFYKGFAIVKSTTGWGVINEKVQWVVPPRYDMIDLMFDDSFELVMATDTTWKQIKNGVLNDVPVKKFMPLEDTIAAAPEPNLELEEDPRQPYIDDIVRRLELIYDEVWGYEGDTYHPACFGRKNGKIALIGINEDKNTAYQTLPLFDEVKDWVFPVVRKGRSWSVVKDFGFKTEVDTALIVRPTYTLEPLIADADDIVEADRYVLFDLYYYINKGQYGILIKPDYDAPWKVFPAQFKSITTVPNWFHTNYLETEKIYLYRVTMPDGRTGFVNSKGVLLFK